MFICLDLGGTILRGALFEQGKLNYFFLKEHQKNLDSIQTLLKESVKELLQRSEKPVKAIGLASAGPFLAKEQVYLRPPNLPYLANFKVGDFIRQEFNLPFYLENDAQAAALGEVYFGSLQGFKNILYLTLGTGLGSGIVLGGKLFRANLGSGPELGHLFGNFSGVKCGCGKRGCIETLLQAQALFKLAKKQGMFLSSLEELKVLYLKKDKKAKKVLEIYGQRLGFFVAELIQVFGFEAVGLGGGLTFLGDYFLPFTKKAVQFRLKNRKELYPQKIVLSEEPHKSALWGMRYLLSTIFVL